MARYPRQRVAYSARRYAILAIITVVLVVVSLKNSSFQTPADRPTSNDARDLKLIHADDRPFVNPKAEIRSERERSTQQRKLEKLKIEWLTLSEVGTTSSARLLLENKSVDDLSCSSSLVELIEFLARQDIYNSIPQVAGKLFAGDSREEAIESLVSLEDSTSSDGTNYRELWSSDAGYFSSIAEIDDLVAKLDDSECAQEALFAHNRASAPDNPISAVKGTLVILEDEVKSRSSSLAMYNLVKALPADVDYHAIEQLFPPIDPTEELHPINQGRVMLFERWAISDPASAANYVMANPGRLSPSLVGRIAAHVVAEDLASGLEWVQTFSSGEYFDQAAFATITQLQFTYPIESRHLMSLIEDPEIRAIVEESINHSEMGKDH